MGRVRFYTDVTFFISKCDFSIHTPPIKVLVYFTVTNDGEDPGLVSSKEFCLLHYLEHQSNKVKCGILANYQLNDGQLGP